MTTAIAIPSRVLIIGGGLGGPALAIGLARSGIKSTIFERRSSPQTIGGVLMLAPNAIRILDKILGLEPKVRKIGRSFDNIELCIDNGSVLEKAGSIPISMGTKEKYRGVTINRPAFHQVLLDACNEYPDLIKVEYNKNLSKIEEDEKQVTAIFDDDSSSQGDILFGVDGINSKVRDHVLQYHNLESVTPKFTGCVVLGNTLPRSSVSVPSHLLDTPTFLYTQAGTLLVFPTDAEAENLQWAAIMPEKERPRKEWDNYRTSGEALKDLKDAWKDIKSEPVRSLVDTLNNENLMLWAPYEIPNLKSWHTDRCCLLGDASHAFSPAAGQGTAQALEDIGLMTLLLENPAASSKGYNALFTHFETVRQKRLEFIKKFTDRQQVTRYPTPNGWAWLGKRMLFKAAFAAMSVSRSLGRGSPLDYDVTQESLVVA